MNLNSDRSEISETFFAKFVLINKIRIYFEINKN